MVWFWMILTHAHMAMHSWGSVKHAGGFPSRWRTAIQGGFEVSAGPSCDHDAAFGDVLRSLWARDGHLDSKGSPSCAKFIAQDAQCPQVAWLVVASVGLPDDLRIKWICGDERQIPIISRWWLALPGAWLSACSQLMEKASKAPPVDRFIVSASVGDLKAAAGGSPTTAWTRWEQPSRQPLAWPCRSSTVPCV